MPHQSQCTAPSQDACSAGRAAFTSRHFRYCYGLTKQDVSAPLPCLAALSAKVLAVVVRTFAGKFCCLAQALIHLAECPLPAERLERESVSKDFKCTAVTEALLRKVRANFWVEDRHSQGTIKIRRRQLGAWRALLYSCALGQTCKLGSAPCGSCCAAASWLAPVAVRHAPKRSAATWLSCASSPACATS